MFNRFSNSYPLKHFSRISSSHFTQTSMEQGNSLLPWVKPLENGHFSQLISR